MVLEFLDFLFIRYQLPLALVGLLSCLALWDAFKFCGGRFGLDQYPTTKLILICIAQSGEFIFQNLFFWLYLPRAGLLCMLCAKEEASCLNEVCGVQGFLNFSLNLK